MKLTGLAAMCAALALVGAASLAAAAPAAPTESPAPSGSPSLAPNDPSALAAPRLLNEREVLEVVMRPMLETGLVADGTTFAAIGIGDDGRATPRAFYGAVYAASDPLARLVWQATAAARFEVPKEPGGALGERGWGIFWVFQTNGCRPWTFDAPRDATVIRVCLNVKDGRVDGDGSFYLVDALPRPRTGPQDTIRLGPPRIVPYPSGARKRGEGGDITMRFTIDSAGHVLRSEDVEAHGPREFRDWFETWQRSWQLELPPGFVPPGGTRTITVRAAFAVARPGTRDCIFVLPEFEGPGESVRVCASRHP